MSMEQWWSDEKPEKTEELGEKCAPVLLLPQ
jgi:hypothetical protein